MRICRMISCTALVGILAAAAVPAAGTAQVGGALKKAAKQKVKETAAQKAVSAAGVRPDTVVAGGAAPGSPADARTGEGAVSGPVFSENVLEITPELLDRFEKGLAAEAAVRQEIDALTGKVLPPESYDSCRQAVLSGPEVQKIYMEVGESVPDDATPEQLQKASQELAGRLEQLLQGRCGLDPQRAAEVRRQHADRLAAAAPNASGLTERQLSFLKERIVPLCGAMDSLAGGEGEARIPTESEKIYWVYTRGEVDAAQPRCVKLMTLAAPPAP